MAALHLPLKALYFDQIKAGTKAEEFRLVTPYWTKRLAGRTFDHIELTKGYPPRGDQSRRLIRPWRGLHQTTITHPHFGPDPVTVYAIRVNPQEP
ncbi:MULTISPECIES: ASCH domain-containing protein [Sulfitobacter]|uniref:ASCH domain-containing protein n=1 Tax=Sulfitobacter profundi TaxID=2679961 RepID=A0ABW1YU95_9RHOB|nr:ASCH domain-containing protein [Sulfitobacter indolifex]